VEEEVFEVAEVTVVVTIHEPIFHSTRMGELHRILKKEVEETEEQEIKADSSPGL
jgi:hypothetical protein